jgi:hypothetical protein
MTHSNGANRPALHGQPGRRRLGNFPISKCIDPLIYGLRPLFTLRRVKKGLGKGTPAKIEFKLASLTYVQLKLVSLAYGPLKCDEHALSRCSLLKWRWRRIQPDRLSVAPAGLENPRR